MISSEILGVSSGVLYLISATLLVKSVKNGSGLSRKWPVLLPAIIGVCMHGLLLLQNVVLPNAFDLNFVNALSLTACLMSTILLLLSIRQPVETLGVVVLPISALTVLTATFYDPSGNTTPLEIQSHIFFSVTAYGLLGLGALQAMLVSVQIHHLHNHRPGGFIRALPPLNMMENILFTMLTAGFIMLSFSLASGFAFLDDMFAQHLVHKTLLSIGAWILFAILLFGRWRYGWRGRRAVSWTFWAFAMLILAYFGSKFVLEFLISTTGTQ